MRGKAWGVRGPVDSSELGITLTHEHLFIDQTTYFKLPEEARERTMARSPLSLENLAWVRFHPYLNEDNLRLDDEEMMVEESSRFKNAEGRTIVDATSIGIGRNPEALKRISTRTGLNIIAGSGYYVSTTHPRSMGLKSVDEIKNEIVKDIQEGIDGSGIRAGLIGEIGTTFPWGTNEEKSLQAAGRAQVETGAPVEVHPGRNPKHPGMILDILEKEGVDSRRVVICHVERTLGDLEQFRTVLDRGAYVEFDNFGQSWFAFPGHKMEWPFPSDSARVFRLRELVEAGYAEQLLVSMDIDSKILLYRYGGQGFDHILVNVLPIMQSVIGLENTQRIMTDNPRRLMTFT
ncbi:MAG: phosphotriesterase-related protein [Candidatus Bathyarchaeia archaeon]|jgi:phosphotriesterase-related protein